MKSWDEIISNQSKYQYYNELQAFLDEQYATKTVYPPRDKVFNAFMLTPFEKTRVVIIGQDPYHRPNQANGLAFSVNRCTSLPPTLKNIFKEISC